MCGERHLSLLNLGGTYIMENNDDKKVASSKQEGTKTVMLPMFLSAKDIHSEIESTLGFIKFLFLGLLKLCKFGISFLIRILPSAQEFVEFLISILSCKYKEGFFCFNRAFYTNFPIRSFCPISFKLN